MPLNIHHSFSPHRPHPLEKISRFCILFISSSKHLPLTRSMLVMRVSKKSTVEHPRTSSLNKTSEGPVGLRILIQCSECDSNNVVKPAFRSIKPTPSTYQTPSFIQESSFLKACHLCNKLLSPQKDVYMYRGDQGFCSIECRCRQIFLDEMKEIEAVLTSSRHWRSRGQVKSGRRRAAVPAAA